MEFKTYDVTAMIAKWSSFWELSFVWRGSLSMSSSSLRRSSAGFWEDGMFRLFVAHLAVEKGYASELKRELLRYEISGFVAHRV